MAGLQLLWCCFHLALLLLIVEPCHMASVEVSLFICSDIQHKYWFIHYFIIILIQARKTVLIVSDVLRNCKENSVELIVSTQYTA